MPEPLEVLWSLAPVEIKLELSHCGKFVNGVNPYDDGETWMK